MNLWECALKDLLDIVIKLSNQFNQYFRMKFTFFSLLSNPIIHKLKKTFLFWMKKIVKFFATSSFNSHAEYNGSDNQTNNNDNTQNSKYLHEYTTICW